LAVDKNSFLLPGGIGQHLIHAVHCPCLVVDHDHDIVEFGALHSVLCGEWGLPVCVDAVGDGLGVRESKHGAGKLCSALGTAVKALRHDAALACVDFRTFDQQAGLLETVEDLTDGHDRA
jgi:hypothetical protein